MALHGALVRTERSFPLTRLPTRVRRDHRVILRLRHLATEAMIHQRLGLSVAAVWTGDDLALASCLAPEMDALEVIDLKALDARPNWLLQLYLLEACGTFVELLFELLCELATSLRLVAYSGHRVKLGPVVTGCG